MSKMRMVVLLAATLHLLFSFVTCQVIAVSEDGEEYELDGGSVLPSLKLGLPICAYKADAGSCRAIHIRYFFNILTRQCEMFNFGGCKGNENNFLTQEECQEACIVPDVPEKIKRHSSKTEKPSYCLLKSEVGTCRGLIRRYFYNKETEECEKFYYGGCLGNENNFRSLKECQDTCQDSTPSANSLHTDDDSILVSIINNSTPVAKQVYSANSLETEDVNILFSKTNNSSPVAKPESPLLPSLCVMPMDKGLCRASEKRYFYNYTTRKCRPFSYTGCGGNENNFTSRKACLRMCKKGFIKKQGQRGIMKIRRKRKKQPAKLIDQEIVIERI
ncbi:tissue factor pathway inhibitor isoform X2 [Elgaria multicarinata webbii]